MNSKTLSRKDFLLGAGALLGSGAFASPVRSALGSRASVIEAEESAWENPYITDGLIAMWDGEWNIGPYTHSYESLIWKDLVGNNDATIISNGGAIINDQSISFNANDFATIEKTASWQMIEICCYPNISRGNKTYNLFVGMPGLWNNTTNSATLVFGFDSSTKPYWFPYITQYKSGYLPLNTAWGTTYPISPFTITYGRTCGGVNGNLNNLSGSNNNYYYSNYRGINVPYGNNSATAQIEYYNIRLYDRILSEEEVLHNYEVDRERFGF